MHPNPNQKLLQEMKIPGFHSTFHLLWSSTKPWPSRQHIWYNTCPLPWVYQLDLQSWTWKSLGELF
jgi:hypothetical protein